MPEPTFGLTLRSLPLPAKLVLTCFLIAVGLGYSSAMVQLHMKHSSKNGNPLPSPADVIERFSGLKLFDPADCAQVSKVELLVTGNRETPDVSKNDMTPAFFAKSKGYAKECDQRTRATVDAERETERLVLIDWMKNDPKVMRETYEKDDVPFPRELKGQPLTAALQTATGVKIKTLIDERCMKCHATESPSLGSWGELEKFVTVPPAVQVKGPGGIYVPSTKQIDVEKLTQSTHAHLLSFAVLFTLTGLTFAFTTYWRPVRCVLAPVVLVGQVADVSCWWLARIPDHGPYFALTIMGTGAVVGIGLFLQIVLSLFNMYGWAGKAVLVLLALLFFGGAGYLGEKVIRPALEDQRAEADQKKKAAMNPGDKPAKPAPAAGAAKVAHFEMLVMGPIRTDDTVKFNGKGTMAPAFFEKDGQDFRKLLKDAATDEEKKALHDLREGERLAVQAWVRLDDAARRAAFETDRLALPPARVGKPITEDYLHDDKAAVKLKSILTDRCARCHQKDGDDGAAAEYPLTTYDEVLKYLVPAGAPKPVAEKPIPPAN